MPGNSPSAGHNAPNFTFHVFIMVSPYFVAMFWCWHVRLYSYEEVIGATLDSIGNIMNKRVLACKSKNRTRVRPLRIIFLKVFVVKSIIRAVTF